MQSEVFYFIAYAFIVPTFVNKSIFLYWITFDSLSEPADYICVGLFLDTLLHPLIYVSAFCQ